MLFSSIPFLYYFLPAVLILYFIAPRKLKNSVLLLASLFFYAWGEPKYIILMAVSILVGYISGLLIEKTRERKKLSKLFMILSVAICLGFLGYFKYVDFFIENVNAVTGIGIPLLKIALPIGISFYTFQILSYTIDVYRGSAAAQKNIINFACYVALFPQLIAGPIVRYTDIAAELENRTHSFDKIASGTRRFILGLGKKVLIANLAGELCAVFRASDDKSVVFAWMYAIAYMIQIYFDFSGYSDMAIGLGRIFGFSFPENFDYPYASKSITEFWRRWHMTLGSWFRDYVYIPLGGNRVPKWRWFLNIFIVWMLTGFWHGAAWNFIIWGLMFAVILVLEKLFLLKWLEKVPGFVRHIYTLFLVMISFVIFNAADMKQAFSDIGSLFGLGGLEFVNANTLYYLRSYGVLLIVAIIGATPFLKNLVSKITSSIKGNRVISYVEPVVLVALLVIVTGYLIDSSFNPFLYFRF